MRPESLWGAGEELRVYELRVYKLRVYKLRVESPERTQDTSIRMGARDVNRLG